MTSRTAVKLMLAFVLGLPILMAVFGWVTRLLTAMGDAAAATVLRHVSTGVSVVWLVSVVGLVVALAAEKVGDPHMRNGGPNEGPNEQ